MGYSYSDYSTTVAALLTPATRMHGGPLSIEASIGPFSLLNYQFNSGALTVPRMQMVGWLCQVMRRCPPRISAPVQASRRRTCPRRRQDDPHYAAQSVTIFLDSLQTALLAPVVH